MAYDLGTAHGKIELSYDGAESVDKAKKDIDSVGDKSKDTDRDLSKLGATLKGLGKGASLTFLTVGMTNAAAGAADLVVELLGIVPQLTSIASLASALPALFAGGAAALGTFKAITAGVGDTLKAAFDPKGAKKFAEGLKELSPAAQEFARAVQANVKPLQEYQKSVQEAFFSASGLTKALPVVSDILEQFRPHIIGMAHDFGEVTKQVAAFATEGRTVTFLEDSISTFRDALNSVRPAIEPILTGLRAVGEVGMPLLLNLGGAVGDLGVKFGNWLNAIASDGRLNEWIDTAIGTLKTLGGILQNVGSILQSVFQAAGQTGGGLLQTIEKVTGAFATFLNSAEGSAALRSLFQGISDVASQLSPVITTLAGALAGALGPALTRIATELGPVLLQVVQALAPAFAPLAKAIADVVIAVAPLLPPLAQAVALFAQLAAGALSSIASELGPVIGLLGQGLVSVLKELAPVIQQALVQGLPLAAQAGLALLQAFRPLLPVMIQFGQVLAQSLMDNLPALLSIAQQLLPVIAQLAAAFAGNLATALQAIIPLIPTIVSGIVAFLRVFYGIISVMLQVYTAIMQFIGGLAQIPGKIVEFVTAAKNFIVNGFNAVVTAVSTAITSIVNFFTALPGRIGAGLAALPGVVWNLIKNTATQAAFLFGQMIGTLVSLSINVPRRIGAALAALPGVVANLARSAWNAARSAFVAGVNAAVSFARQLPGRTRSAISALVGNLRSLAVSAWNALKSAFSGGINNAVSLARGLPGRIKGALGNLGSLLASAGRDAVQGLINGLRSGIGAAADAARSLGSSVMSGIRSTLKIKSPSKAMITIGRYVVQGLEKGLLGSAAQIKAASNKLANYINDAFSNKLIKRGARNSVLSTLASGTRQLTALVNRTNTVAAQLKNAQTKLADVQKAYNDVYANAVQKTKDTFSLVTSGQTFVNLDLTKERFQAAVDQAKKFAANIANLAKRGLNKDLLQQLVDAGAADGGAMAAALAGASSATIKEFNALQGQLTSAAKSVGKTTADAMYGAGLKAAQGLVAGLQKQQVAIQRQMDKIADAMVARIKKALKIKSPSRIMFNLGRFTTEGLLDGLLSLKRQVALAAQQLATSSIIPTVQLTASKSAAQAQQNAASAAVGGSVFQYNQTVNALPGMSASAVAKYSLDRMKYALTGGVVAAALPTPSPAGV